MKPVIDFLNLFVQGRASLSWSSCCIFNNGHYTWQVSSYSLAKLQGAFFNQCFRVAAGWWVLWIHESEADLCHNSESLKPFLIFASSAWLVCYLCFIPFTTCSLPFMCFWSSLLVTKMQSNLSLHAKFCGSAACALLETRSSGRQSWSGAAGGRIIWL